MRLYFTDELHGLTLGAPLRVPAGKVSMNVLSGWFVSECAAYPAYQVNNMTGVLRLFVELHMRVVAVPAQVIACQIDQHDVFGILFRVGQQGSWSVAICFFVSTSAGCSGNGVDRRLSIFYFTVCFWR